MNRRQAAKLAIFIACRDWVRMRDLPDRALGVFRSMAPQPSKAEDVIATGSKNLAQGMIGEGLLMVSWRLAADDRTKLKGFVQQPGAQMSGGGRWNPPQKPKTYRCSWCGKKFSFPGDALKVSLLSGRETKIHKTCFQAKEHHR